MRTHCRLTADVLPRNSSLAPRRNSPGPSQQQGRSPAGSWSQTAASRQGTLQQEHVLAAAAAKLLILYQQLLAALELVVAGQDHRLPQNIVPLTGSFSDRAVSQQAHAHSWVHWYRYQGL